MNKNSKEGYKILKSSLHVFPFMGSRWVISTQRFYKNGRKWDRPTFIADSKKEAETYMFKFYAPRPSINT